MIPTSFSASSKPPYVIPTAAAAIPTPTPMALIQEGGQAGGVVVQDRVMERLRWIEKLIFVAIFLAMLLFSCRNLDFGATVARSFLFSK